MEDVLTVYALPKEQTVARLCLDERPCQLIEDVLMPLPMQAGSTKRIDNEYKRMGTCSVFVAYDLDSAVRYAEVKEHRTKQDYADFVNDLIAQYYSNVEKVMLVQDNLNIHKKGSFYENLPIARAAELAQLIEFHFTPKHGSWLNMAEIEFSALCRQCLNRRIAGMEELAKELKAWIAQRNEDAITIHWSFTVKDAREKMKSQYQKVNSKN
jgi:transposase